jgi:adenosine deaminase
MKDLVAMLPKAELHMHLEGSLEPELLFSIAARNDIALPYASVEELRQAYRFSDLQEFLDIYYQGMNVLRHEQDYHDLTTAYLARCAADNVRHVEIFFDPQGHTERGVAFDTAIKGILSGLEHGKQTHGISSCLIMSFLRHLSEEDGFATLKQAEPWLDRITAVGLDSSEVGHPPAKFARLFAECRSQGLKLCMHAGEEGPPDYVRQALYDIGVDRIDHGNRAMEDPQLVAEIIRQNMTLTVCPLSNTALKVIAHIKDSPVRKMLEAGIAVTINSDDPAYFGGYVGANYVAVDEGLSLSAMQLRQLAINSFSGSFLSQAEKNKHLEAMPDAPQANDGDFTS